MHEFEQSDLEKETMTLTTIFIKMRHVIENALIRKYK